MKNKKGFTLIELLAVIVILGIIMLVAIPAVTGYISGSRNDSYINDASLFVDGMKNVAITKNRLPFANGQVALFQVWNAAGTGLSLESGGKQSPYGVNWDEDYTYIAIANVNGNYEYAFAGNDTQGNYIPLSTLNYLTDANAKVYLKNAGSMPNSEYCIENEAKQAARPTTECTGGTPTWTTGSGTNIKKGFTSLTAGTTGTGISKIYINGIGADTARTEFTVVAIHTDNK